MKSMCWMRDALKTKQEITTQYTPWLVSHNYLLILCLNNNNKKSKQRKNMLSNKIEKNKNIAIM